jgi:hypothetical protein
VGRALVEAVGEAVEVVGEDSVTLGEAVEAFREDPMALSEDPAALGEAAVTEAWRRTWRRGCTRRGPGGGWRGTDGGHGRRSGRQTVRHRRWTRRQSMKRRRCVGMEAVLERACGWRGNDSQG